MLPGTIISSRFRCLDSGIERCSSSSISISCYKRRERRGGRGQSVHRITTIRTKRSWRREEVENASRLCCRSRDNEAAGGEETSNKASDQAGVNKSSGEDNGEVELIKKLEAAEKEAAELRQRLSDAEVAAAVTKPRRPDLPRVDSQLGYRETVFDLGGGRGGKDGDGKQAVGTFSSGLTEREMAEAGILENDTDADAITRTRLLQSIGLIAVTAVFSQIRLFDKPKKPLFLYLVSCLQLQKVLGRMKDYAKEGEWISLQQGLTDVKKPPINARESLLGAANSLPEKAQKEKAEEIALEVLDYINQADFRQYFDPQTVPVGPRAVQFSEFSFKAISSAEAGLTKFLNLMPREDLEGAIAQTTQSFPTALPSADTADQ